MYQHCYPICYGGKSRPENRQYEPQKIGFGISQLSRQSTHHELCVLITAAHPFYCMPPLPISIQKKIANVLAGTFNKIDFDWML